MGLGFITARGFFGRVTMSGCGRVMIIGCGAARATGTRIDWRGRGGAIITAFIGWRPNPRSIPFGL